LEQAADWLEIMIWQPSTAHTSEQLDLGCSQQADHTQSASQRLHPSSLQATTYCTYPRREGQAELTWVAGYIPR